MKFDIDNEDSELMRPIFRWGFVFCSAASFALAYILDKKLIEEYDHWYYLFSFVCLLVSLYFSKENKEKE